MAASYAFYFIIKKIKEFRQFGQTTSVHSSIVAVSLLAAKLKIAQMFAAGFVLKYRLSIM